MTCNNQQYSSSGHFHLEDYRLISRGGTGGVAIALPDDNTINLAGALNVHGTDEIMIWTAKGQSIRCPVAKIRKTNQGAKRVKLLTLPEGDKLPSIARPVETEEEQEAANKGATE